MQLVITLDGLEKLELIRNLHVAISALYGGQVAAVTHVGVPTLDHVALVEHGDTPDTQVHLPPEDDAAALLAHGGVIPPPGAGTDSTPALPSGNVVAPPPGTAAPTAEVRLDSAGMPYDIRIHSGAMSTKKDGTWTAKRGVSDLVIAQVEGEHRAAGYGHAVSPGVTTTITPAPAAGTTVVTPPPSGVAPPPAGVPGPPTDANAFRELVNVMGTKMQGGELNKAQIDGALAAIGLKAIPELQQNLHLIDTLKLHLGL
jgi:hypothetical protein